MTVTYKGAFDCWEGLRLYVLYDRWGAILHEWPEGHSLSLGEVFEVCFELLRR